MLPMLATKGTVDDLSPELWAFEVKWDGWRAQWDGASLRSRTGLDFTEQFPGFVRPDLGGHRAVLDGELVVVPEGGVPTLAALHLRTRTTPVEFWAFDILQLNSAVLIGATYRDRRKVLEALAAKGDLVVPAQVTGDVMTQAREQGWEGIVAKRWDSTYRAGRSRSWIKQKVAA